ncbi:hypothetical protein PA7_41980 [Pseudonocardia asaccharolytica DSM 44247 = NBRC 16224]|uniref:Uncharacterized protein n=1 Tax=Pseudonocardia asaccharolytica DSM 44247 = NBRC 16224 TaxID=1123024 RepID=A0A511D6E9_9PSEU|nr:hypothetical protein PA7_41980 [Pseudonocardia asaccharolytica DSM 44247 = NBRC 16224]
MSLPSVRLAGREARASGQAREADRAAGIGGASGRGPVAPGAAACSAGPVCLAGSSRQTHPHRV